MLSLDRISLFQFKNYIHRSFDFTGRIVGICGNNGVGKTNLLDAIHYLCFTRSYFSRQDAANVHHGMNGFRIDGEFELNGKRETAACILRETGKKEFLLDGNPYARFSQHIGRYPCVVIAPDDALLIMGGSEERRKFIDALLSQLDADYLQHLIQYTRVLQQRNSLLRSFAESGEVDEGLLSVFDEQLIPPGNYIFERRKEFLVSFLPLVKHVYHSIAGSIDTEQVMLIYESELLDGDFASLLKAARHKDRITLRTNCGIHRDELDITLADTAFRHTASQGQRKSLLFAMKLAELEVLQKEKGFAPILLLDDIFEKLDADRISNLLQKVCVENDGQVFITDTDAERLERQLASPGIAYQSIVL